MIRSNFDIINESYKKYNDLSDIKVLNMFISDYINNSKKSTSGEVLQTLGQFLQEIDYTLNIDIYISIVKTNNELNNLLSRLIVHYMDIIKNNQLDEAIQDKFIVNCIDTYCMLNNIATEDVDRRIQNILDKYIDSSFLYDDVALDMYMKQVIDKPLLKNDEEKRLFYLLKMGYENARDILVECNLKLPIYIAKKYINYGIPLDDLISEGNIGLMVSIEKFDISKGYKFSTYAYDWVDSYIRKSIMVNGRMIRLPIHKEEDLIRIKQAIGLLQSKGIEPSILEISKMCDISEDDIKYLLYIDSSVTSLNQYIGDGEDELGDLVPSKSKPVDEMVIDKISLEEFDKIFKKAHLKPREIEVFILHNGIGDYQLTLDQIADKYGLTKERIRQIESKAIDKLKNYFDNIAAIKRK